MEWMTGYYESLLADFPLVSIEDPLAEDGWSGWVHLTDTVGDRVQLVGDDLFVTNPERLARGNIRRRCERVAGEGESNWVADRDLGCGGNGHGGRLLLDDVPSFG